MGTFRSHNLKVGGSSLIGGGSCERWWIWKELIRNAVCGTVCEPIIVAVYDALCKSFGNPVCGVVCELIGNAVCEPIRAAVCKPIENAV